MPSPHDFINRELPRFRAELFDLLRIPSISTDPDRAGDVAEAAEWLAARMRQAGLEASVEPTAGHPLVLGRHRTRDRDVPTLLVYGHYDVQPPEPLGPWTSPPFEPELRDGRIWGRGAADDKSQIFLQIAAVEAALATTGLPIDLVLLFEGEEEIGSPSLGPWLAERAGRADSIGSDATDAGRTGAADTLTADHVLVADSMMLGPGRPSLIVGMRGIAYFEVEATIGSTDLHSGQYGGAVPNPANALAAVLASLHEDGRVAIDGFYDDVVMPPEHVLEEWRWVAFDDDAFRRTAGGAELRGEPGFSTLERLWARPALDVNGLVAGYTGPGKKTVLPASALAKLSTRLVPEQDPDRIEALLREHVGRAAPDGVAFEVRKLQSNPPWREDASGPLLTAAARALESVFGARPSLVAHGGSIPIAPVLRDALDASLAVLGFAVPGANMHAPDEWFPADHLEKGMKTMTELYSRLAEAS